jgi:hypothetical protein
MDILEQLFIKKSNYKHMIQEQVPGGNNPLCILPCHVKLCHATARTGSCFFTDTSVILMLPNTVHAAR